MFCRMLSPRGEQTDRQTDVADVYRIIVVRNDMTVSDLLILFIMYRKSL